MNEKKLFIVDTIVTFRNRYIVQANNINDAYDEVTMLDSGNDNDYFESFSQKYLGETIVDGRKISKRKFEKMVKKLEEDSDFNESGSYWMGEDLIHRIKYEND